MALVIALAVNNGFRAMLETNLLGATPHVALLEKDPSNGIADWRADCDRLRKLPGVTAAEPSTAKSSPRDPRNRPKRRSKACASTPRRSRNCGAA